MTAIQERRAVYGEFATRELEVAGAGPPIVLLHGFSESADAWRAVLGRLADAGAAAVAVDLPHFGRADRPGRGPLLEMWDEFSAALVARHGSAGGVVLGGDSLGGLLALRAAERGDLPLTGVMAVGPAGLGFQPWVMVVERAGLTLSLAARTRVPEAVVRRMAGRLYGRLAATRPVAPEILDLYASHITAADLPRIVRLARSVLAELALGDAVHPERIEVPVTLLWGSRDRFCPPQGAQRILDVLPDTKVEVLEGVGHCVQIQEPDLVAARLLELSSDRRRRAARV